MKNLKSREIMVLAGAVVLLLLPFLWGGYYIAQKHGSVQTKLAELEPRYSRLLGLQAQRGELSDVLVQVQAARERYVYPAAQDATQAGNAAQQRVRDIFSSAGLQVISSQVLPPKSEKGFDRIPLTVSAEGEALALQSTLAVLSSQEPIIVINVLDVQLQGGLGNPNLKGEPRLSVQFSLSVLRERS